MGKGNQGLEDMDTLIKEQNDVDKNDNNNLLNTLVDKLPVFSQSFIEETQKTPIKIEENKDNNNDKERKDNNDKNINKIDENENKEEKETNKDDNIIIEKNKEEEKDKDKNNTESCPEYCKDFVRIKFDYGEGWISKKNIKKYNSLKQEKDKKNDKKK